MASGIAQLRKLSDLISASVSRIENELGARNLDFPALDTLYTEESEAARTIPEVFKEVNVITAAAGQIAALSQPPATKILDMARAVSCHITFERLNCTEYPLTCVSSLTLALR
jgi:hypothetical protein